MVESLVDILSDPEIQLVVEVMGGTSLAKDVIFRAITQGKHVVTANKAVIAQELANLSQLLQENPNVKFGYEAAVCGGLDLSPPFFFERSIAEKSSYLGVSCLYTCLSRNPNYSFVTRITCGR